MAWFAGNLIAPILVLLVLALVGVANYRRIRRWMATRHLPSVVATPITVLVANLDRDKDGKRTRRVELAFEGQTGIEIRRHRAALRVRDTGNVAENIVPAEAQGRSWLQQHEADVLIWGEVAEADKALRLRFLAASPATGNTLKSYRLDAMLQLPENFGVEFIDVLCAVALSSVAPATHQQGQFLADILRPAVEEFERFLETPPPALRPEELGNVRSFFGNAATVLGEQSGQERWLKAAVSAFHAALAAFTHEDWPAAWATTQNDLGVALRMRGERENATARLEEAVEAHRAVLGVHTRDRRPLDRAIIQNNLANALQRLGDRQLGTARIEEAVEAYRAALAVHTRDRLPLQWATTQSNLGAALRTLGERVQGTARLSEAVEAYREVLEVHTRQRLRLCWAATQNNLGAALRTLGEREEETARLKAAIEAHRAALEVHTRGRLPLDWAMTQNHLGAALRTLGDRERGMARLEEAIETLPAALEIRTRERLPLAWATIQNNLGAALRALGEREQGTTMLEEAVEACRSALEVFERMGASSDATETRRNLARIEELMAERRTE